MLTYQFSKVPEMPKKVYQISAEILRGRPT